VAQVSSGPLKVKGAGKDGGAVVVVVLVEVVLVDVVDVEVVLVDVDVEVDEVLVDDVDVVGAMVVEVVGAAVVVVVVVVGMVGSGAMVGCLPARNSAYSCTVMSGCQMPSRHSST
jgi:hypothetical protein